MQVRVRLGAGLSRLSLADREALTLLLPVSGVRACGLLDYAIEQYGELPG